MRVIFQCSKRYVFAHFFPIFAFSLCEWMEADNIHCVIYVSYRSWWNAYSVIVFLSFSILFSLHSHLFFRHRTAFRSIEFVYYLFSLEIHCIWIAIAAVAALGCGTRKGLCCHNKRNHNTNQNGHVYLYIHTRNGRTLTKLLSRKHKKNCLIWLYTLVSYRFVWIQSTKHDGTQQAHFFWGKNRFVYCCCRRFRSRFFCMPFQWWWTCERVWVRK